MNGEGINKPSTFVHDKGEKKIGLFCNWGRPGGNNVTVQEGGVFLHGICAVCTIVHALRTANFY